MQLDTLFDAKSLAVVGASTDETKVGHQILKNLTLNKNLTLYPVNLKGGNILGHEVYTHLSKTPTVPDVTIISIPAEFVESVIDECIKVKTKAVILISSGFAEMGEAGAQLQSKIVDKLKTANIILLGPNSMGYLSPHKEIFATFGPGDVKPGSIAVISQSGAMLSALFDEYNSSGVGISTAFSLGNRVGIAEHDCLEYALADDQTKVIAIYLESVSDPQKLLNTLVSTKHKKPILLLKGGTTQEGRVAAVSHTAALATSEVLLSSLCHQVGIVQVANFEQLVRASIAASLSHYLPENVMIITNAGGPAVVLTDEIASAGIPLHTLSPRTGVSLKESLPGLKLGNPLDLLGDATPDSFKHALNTLYGDSEIDVVAVIITKQAVTDLDAITTILSRKRGKHIVFACIAGGDDLEIYRTKLKSAGLIVTRYPNEIAETLSLLYQAKKNFAIQPTTCLDARRAYDLRPASTQGGPTTHPYPVSYLDTLKLLESCGLKTPAAKIINSESELNTLSTLGYPLIAKTTNLEIKHKGKIGAIMVDLIGKSECLTAYTKLKQWGSSVVFQEKIKSGHEVLLGAHHDPVWGWYIALGLGGSLSDTYDDRVYIFLPAEEDVIKSALARTKLSSLLNPLQTKLLITGIHKFQDLVLSVPKLTELEINPLFITDSDLIAADLKRS
jgi:acetyltransferase